MSWHGNVSFCKVHSCIENTPCSHKIHAIRGYDGTRLELTGGQKICQQAPEEAEVRRLAHARWPIACMQGALLSDLRPSAHFAHVASALTEKEIAQAVICSPQIPHVTWRQSHRRPRRVLRTSGSTKS